jgi:spore germination protein YaaH
MNNAIQNILNNPFLKKALFKQLITAMKNNNIELLCITLDEKGDIQVKEYTDKMTVMKTKDWSEFLIKSLNAKNKANY